MQMVSALGPAHWFEYYQSGLVIQKKPFLYTVGTPLKARVFPRVFPGCFLGVSRVFPGCFPGVSWVFPGRSQAQFSLSLFYFVKNPQSFR